MYPYFDVKKIGEKIRDKNAPVLSYLGLNNVSDVKVGDIMRVRSMRMLPGRSRYILKRWPINSQHESDIITHHYVEFTRKNNNGRVTHLYTMGLSHFGNEDVKLPTTMTSVFQTMPRSIGTGSMRHTQTATNFMYGSNRTALFMPDEGWLDAFERVNDTLYKEMYKNHPMKTSSGSKTYDPFHASKWLMQERMSTDFFFFPHPRDKSRLLVVPRGVPVGQEQIVTDAHKAFLDKMNEKIVKREVGENENIGIRGQNMTFLPNITYGKHCNFVPFHDANRFNCQSFASEFVGNIARLYDRVFLNPTSTVGFYTGPSAEAYAATGQPPPSSYFQHVVTKLGMRRRGTTPLRRTPPKRQKTGYMFSKPKKTAAQRRRTRTMRSRGNTKALPPASPAKSTTI